jgi:hypothetical protein
VEKGTIRIELLLNPFCLCERDFLRLSDICRNRNLTFSVYNLWDIRDEDVDGLPEYMARLIKEWRSGQRAGSVYSSVFVNGERIPINDWPRSFDVVEETIVTALKASETC